MATNDIQITIQARDQTARDLATARANVDHLADALRDAEDEADRLADAFDDATDEVDRLRHNVDLLGSAAPQAMVDALRDAEDLADRLGDELQDAEDEAILLAGALQMAAHQAGDLDNRLRGLDLDLSRNINLAGFATAGAQGAGTFASAFGSAFPDGLMGAIKGNPIIIAGLAGVLAPMIGAALTSAFLLVAGGGVLAAGIGLVLNDSSVQQAVQGFKDRAMDRDTTEMEKSVQDAEAAFEKARLKLDAARKKGNAESVKQAKAEYEAASQELAAARDKLAESMAFNEKNFSLKDAAAPFIEPTKRMFETFAASLDNIMPKLAEVFTKMAPIVDQLAPAFAKMAENSLPGILKAVEASMPFFETLAQRLPEIGEAISYFFNAISEDSDGALQFFDMLLWAIINIIKAFGDLLAFLTHVFEGWTAIMDSAIDFVVQGFRGLLQIVLGVMGGILDAAVVAFGWIPGIGPKLKQAQAEFGEFRNNVNAQLAGINNRSVTVTARLVGDAAAILAGGITSKSVSVISGRASGGLASGLVEVHAGELVDFEGRKVYNANESSRMRKDTGGGGGSGGNVIVNLYVQGSIRSDRELVSLIRNEFMSGGLAGVVRAK